MEQKLTDTSFGGNQLLTEKTFLSGIFASRAFIHSIEKSSDHVNKKPQH